MIPVDFIKIKFKVNDDQVGFLIPTHNEDLVVTQVS